MVSLKTPLYFLEAVFLDFVSIPGKFLPRDWNAKWHLMTVCKLCSAHRKKFRNSKFKFGYCWWYDHWSETGYNCSRSFGFTNWVRYYLGLKTNLKGYSKEFELQKLRILEVQRVRKETKKRIKRIKKMEIEEIENLIKERDKKVKDLKELKKLNKPMKNRVR